MASRESDDGWSLEFQRVQEITLKRLFAGRRCAIFVCKSLSLSLSEKRDALCKLACATAMMNSNKRDYRRSFGQINQFLERC